MELAPFRVTAGRNFEPIKRSTKEEYSIKNSRILIVQIGTEWCERMSCQGVGITIEVQTKIISSRYYPFVGFYIDFSDTYIRESCILCKLKDKQS